MLQHTQILEHGLYDSPLLYTPCPIHMHETLLHNYVTCSRACCAPGAGCTLAVAAAAVAVGMVW